MKKEPIVIKIRNLRQGRDLTQEALAEALGISRQSIIALENGRYMPSLPLACEMAKFFEVALDELFSFENQILSLNANEEDTMKNRVLSPWLGVRSIQEEMDRF
ncbi:MAG: Cro/Cl family transcriptional regulator, partial [Berkelbacteria bacterium GW2011_GWA2_38_9]